MTWFGSLVLLEKRVTENRYKAVLSDHLCPTMRHFYSDGSDLFQDVSALIHSGVTGWFDEYENDVNHMLWSSVSTFQSNLAPMRDVGIMCYSRFHSQNTE